MNENQQTGSNEMNQLMSINEELLRSKGKLLQEIVSLKKQLAAQEKKMKLTEKLQAQVNALNAEIVDHLLTHSMMAAEIEELKMRAATLTKEKTEAIAETERLKQIKWYRRLLGRK